MTDASPITPSKAPWLKTMASPAILFYTLPWLMVLLIAGTIAQKDLGIYLAQKMFFSSWILWFGPFPLPGAYPVLGLMTLCLLAKFLLYSPWRAHQSGIILAHLGVLILLIGGMITAATQTEGFLSLKEEQSGNTVSDYHSRILRIEKNGKDFAAIPYDKLRKGEAVSVDLPFFVKIEDLCQNCIPAWVENPEGRQGFAQKVTLQQRPLEKENEANLYGATFSISGAAKQDGIYVSMEEIPRKAEIKAGGDVYALSIDRARTILPFEITLKNFTRDMHPGTDMARGFSSDIIVQDGAVKWPYKIRMNEPLRYKGYTFYQASFSVRPDGEYSVFSVVRNKGRIFPYIASAIIFAGLLLHVIIRLRTAKEKAT